MAEEGVVVEDVKVQKIKLRKLQYVIFRARRRTFLLYFDT